jgi:hypothetical protein
MAGRGQAFLQQLTRQEIHQRRLMVAIHKLAYGPFYHHG